MPQLNVYLDKETIEKIEAAAKLESSSVSRWVRARLRRSLQTPWPEGYFDLFGALANEKLSRPKPGRFRDDVPREPV